MVDVRAVSDCLSTRAGEDLILLLFRKRIEVVFCIENPAILKELFLTTVVVRDGDRITVTPCVADGISSAPHRSILGLPAHCGSQAGRRAWAGVNIRLDEKVGELTKVSTTKHINAVHFFEDYGHGFLCHALVKGSSVPE